MLGNKWISVLGSVFINPVTYHVNSRCLDFTDILALEINVHYMIF